MKARILGTGSCLSDDVLTNEDLAEIVDTNDEWIRERTGIKKRHITRQGTVEMAVEAAEKALADSKVSAEDLDMILVGTVSPDYLFPTVACLLQERIGAGKVPCMDLSAACSGFLYSLNTAAAWIQTGMYQKVLVVGAETLSRFVDWTDRSTCVLFGDGAGAVVLAADEDGIYGMDMGSDGSKGMALSCPGIPIQNPLYKQPIVPQYLSMDGREIYRFAVRRIPETIRSVAEKTGTDLASVDHFILHQANQRILEAAAKKLKIPDEKMPINIDHCGNLAAASIPVLLDEYNKSGKLKRGDKVLLCAFGGGLTWGSTLMIW